MSSSASTYDSDNLGRFPKVRTGQPDHGRTRHFGNEIGFYQEVLLKNHLLLCIIFRILLIWMVSFIKREILITMGMGWPVSSDKWKAPLVSTRSVKHNRKTCLTLCAPHHDDSTDSELAISEFQIIIYRFSQS